MLINHKKLSMFMLATTVFIVTILSGQILFGSLVFAQPDGGTKDGEQNSGEGQSLTGDPELDEAIKNDKPVVDDGGPDDNAGNSVTGSQKVDEDLGIGKGESGSESDQNQNTGDEFRPPFCLKDWPASDPASCDYDWSKDSDQNQNTGETTTGGSSEGTCNYFLDWIWNGDERCNPDNNNNYNDENQQCDPTVTSCLDQPPKDWTQGTPSGAESGGEGSGGGDSGQGGSSGNDGRENSGNTNSPNPDYDIEDYENDQKMLDDLLKKARAPDPNEATVRPDTRPQQEIDKNKLNTPQKLEYYSQDPLTRYNKDADLMAGGPVAGFMGYYCANCDPYTRSMMINFGSNFDNYMNLKVPGGGEGPGGGIDSNKLGPDYVPDWAKEPWKPTRSCWWCIPRYP